MFGFESRMCHFFSWFFIENNLSYLVGGNIISVALSDTCFLVSISSAKIKPQKAFYNTHCLTRNLSGTFVPPSVFCLSFTFRNFDFKVIKNSASYRISPSTSEYPSSQQHITSVLFHHIS